MPTFYIPAEVKLRGAISVEARNLAEAQSRAENQDITLIDDGFYMAAEIVDWDFGEATEL